MTYINNDVIMRSGEQLTFDFFKNLDFDFDGFFSTERNSEIVSVLKSWAIGKGSSVVYLWGETSVGKTHLLQSSLKSCNRRSIYIPLKEVLKLDPKSFENLEQVGVLAVDDVGVLAGRQNYEEALFRLFNAVVSRGGRLLLSAENHPLRQGFRMKDLTSRLCSHLVYKVWQLPDGEKTAALELLAERRGIKVDRSVWDFILKRSKRDMRSLVELLDELDEYSLTKMRRLTIPLVKHFVASKGIDLDK